MKFKKQTFSSDLEILITEANLVTFSTTVLASNVKAFDENGNKYVKTGALLDKAGNVVTASGDSLSGVPVGVLYQTVNVKDGDEPASLIVEGYLRADRVLDGYSEKAIQAVKTALPKITFM